MSRPSLIATALTDKRDFTPIACWLAGAALALAGIVYIMIK